MRLCGNGHAGKTRKLLIMPVVVIDLSDIVVIVIKIVMFNEL